MKDMKEQEEYSNQLLYHYTSLKGLLGILNTRCIWATAIEDLADETELVYGRDMWVRRFELEARKNHGSPLSSRLEKCAKSTKAMPDISEMIRRFDMEPKKNDSKFKWFIACFSENKDSLPLWRGFTDHCTGYALGLRYIPPRDLFSDFIHWPPKRVIYSKLGQRFEILRTVNEACKKLDDPNDPFAWTIPLGRILNIKDRGFSSEQEWRVVLNNQEPRKFCESTNKPCGVQRDIHYVKLPLTNWEIIEIICGPRTELHTDDSEIREGIMAFGGQPDNVNVEKSKFRLWR